ncbi:hypothetical protein D3C72_1481700 [compost metagenome]
MQADAFADKLRLQDVAFDELAGKEHDERQEDINIVRPELHDGDADGEDEADHGSDIGNEADETRKKADQQTEIQAHQRQANGVINPENDAERPLPAHETGNGLVHVAGDLADGMDIVARYPAVDLVDHPVPVEQEVEGDDGRDDQQRHDIDQRFAGIPYLRQKRADEARALRQEL